MTGEIQWMRDVRRDHEEWEKSRMSTPSLTIRQHLEAIRDACTPDEPDAYEPPRAVICKEHAVAALRELDQAETEWNWIYPPEGSAHQERVRRIVDPKADPVAAATPPRIDEVDFSAYQPGRGYE